MKATTCPLRVTQHIESTTPSQQPATYSAPVSSACQRCGGLIVDEHCLDTKGGHRLWAKRCVQCGDIIDETILAHRYATRPRIQQVAQAA